jgi:hypothetical protein
MTMGISKKLKENFSGFKYYYIELQGLNFRACGGDDKKAAAARLRRAKP